jgi:diguanylate cyclase (GGDEF)-like protein/PAS domain S-box-containing protein
MFAADREGMITLAEGKGLETLGLNPDQVIGQSILDIYRDTPQVEENFRRALAGDAFTSVAEVGGVMFEAWQAPLRDQNGEITGVTGVVTDITERVRAEKALRESEGKFRTLAETISAAAFIFQGTRLRYVNPAAQTITGWTREELLAMDFWDVIHPDFREEAKDRGLAQQRGEPVPTRYEAKLLTKNGDERWLDLTVGVIEFEGNPAVMGTGFDITERKRAEEALQHSETKFRTLTETISAAAFIFQGTRLRHVNSASEELTGYSREELLEMNFWDVMHPDFHEEVKARGLARQRGEQIPTRHEVKLLTKNGEERWVEFTVGVIEFEGKPAVVGTGFDVTERRRAEDALRQSEERYRLVTDNASDMIWTRDLSLRPTYTSPSVTRLRGHTVEEAMAQTLDEVLTPDSLQIARRTLAEEMAKESAGDKDLSRSRTLELEMYHKDGSTVWTEMTVTFLRDEEGRPTGLMGVTRDISERKRAQEALHRREEHFRSLIENASDVILVLDEDGTIRYASPSAKRAAGYEPDELVGTAAFGEIVHSDDQASASDAFAAAAREPGGTLSIAVRVRHKDGSWRDFDGVITNLLADPAVGGFILNCRDVSERKRAEETIRHLAYHDAVTDLPNRTLFKDRLTQALAQARRKKRMLAVLFLDLDRFKIVNDTVGHGEGDKLLRRAADRLAGLVREGDTVARVGGDEFAILSSEISHVEDAAQVAERVLANLRRPWLLQGQEFLVTTSIGIAVYPGDGDDADSLLRSADTAMYRAKESGRDNCQLYTPAMNARIVERLALENDLRRGLERGEFVVYYQPQVNIRSGQVVGVEALVRWQHPERGLVLPAEFIPVAEETGLIVPLGEWVLRTACAQNKACQDAGLPPMRVAVNLSARQFQQRNLTDTVAQALEETGLAPDLLQLEITEGVAMQDVDFTITTLQGLREMGVQIAMDDFGTGYSSLGYLKRFPMDAVKIDRSFVRDLTVDPNDAAIATTVITMAHSLKLSVIAEGVETEEQLAFLDEQECDEMQGYLFSKPVPAAVLDETLRADGRRARARTTIDSA